jgi:uncharacterized protein YcfJ
MTNPKRLSAGLLVIAIQLSSMASADHSETGNAYYAYGEVIKSQPIVRQTTQRTPRKECHLVRSNNKVDRPQRNRALPTLFGGLLGGVIGHQFGGGNGKTALTIAGALAGASIVSNASNPDHHRNTYRGDTYRKAERCTVVHDVQNIETIDGYLVTYLYRGKRFTRTMAEAPGSTVRIRVQVEPVNDAYASNVLLSSKNHF